MHYYRQGQSSKHCFHRLDITGTCPYATARQQSRRRVEPVITGNFQQKAWKTERPTKSKRRKWNSEPGYTVDYIINHVGRGAHGKCVER